MEQKDLPFAYPIKQIAREQVFPQIAYLDELYQGGIETAVEALPEYSERMKRTGGEVTNADVAYFLVDEFWSDSRINVVNHAAAMVLFDHSLLNTWSDEDKRYFLDMAIIREVSWREEEIASEEAFRMYYGQESLGADPEFPSFKEDIVRLKSLQTKLRQRVLPSSAPEKK